MTFLNCVLAGKFLPTSNITLIFFFILIFAAVSFLIWGFALVEDALTEKQKRKGGLGFFKLPSVVNYSTLFISATVLFFRKHINYRRSYFFIFSGILSALLLFTLLVWTAC